MKGVTDLSRLDPWAWPVSGSVVLYAAGVRARRVGGGAQDQAGLEEGSRLGLASGLTVSGAATLQV
jgi:hypothetical protein